MTGVFAVTRLPAADVDDGLSDPRQLPDDPVRKHAVYHTY
jgi:hypothetical protein